MKERSSRRVMLWVGLVALVLRAVYFVEHTGSPFFSVPILDEAYYDSVARVLAAGGEIDPTEIGAGFRPLLYPALLAHAYRLAGDWGDVAIVVVQHLVGVVTTMLVVLLSTRLFRSARAGLVGGLLFALAGPPLFYEGELLNTSLFTCGLLLQVLAFATAGTSGRRWLGCGALTGLISQLRPNALVLALVFVVGGFRRRVVWTGLAGLGLVIVTIAAIESPLVGQWRFAGGSGGVNFYLGNKLGADGMIPRQDVAVTYGTRYRDSVELFAENEYAANGNGRGESLYWMGRALSDIKAEPRRWCALLVDKMAFVIWNEEIPSNRSFDFARRFESTVLTWLPVRWWMLFALAPLGALAARRRGDRDLLLASGGVVLLLTAVMVLFFVNSRFRVPLWPLMAALAGGGLVELCSIFKARRWIRGGVSVGALAVLSMLSLTNLSGSRLPSLGRDFFYRSLALLERGELLAADADARRALVLEPADAAVRFQLGTIALEQGRDLAALESIRGAALLQPGEARIYNNMGIVLERLGRLTQAYDAYRRSLELAPDYPPALVNSALFELRAGLLDAAADKLERAHALGESGVPSLCARGFLARERGDRQRAEELLERARSIDAEVTGRLEEENRKRLAIGRVGSQ